MNGFGSARRIEAKGVSYILPLLKERAHDGQLVMLNKGPLARHLQETVGDAIFNSDPDRVWTVEIKVEQKKTGNLFLEIFSNRNLDRRANHAERGINPGWMFKCRADLLFYYFIDTDDLYVISLFRLQRWAFGFDDTMGRIWRYSQKRQGKYQQLNDTWGAVVPIADLPSDLIKHVHARQISLFECEEDAA